jgi:heme oxygenase
MTTALPAAPTNLGNPVSAANPAAHPLPKQNLEPMPSSKPRTDIMHRLREGTAELHAATEALPLMHKLLAADADTAQYLRYLAALHGVYLAIEPRLYAAVAPVVLKQLGVRPKLPALRADLQALGADPGPPAVGLSQQIQASIQGELAALGGLSVLEGATLGGRVIARRLRRQWDCASELPFSFLEFRGADPAGEWRQFGRGLQDRTTLLAARDPSAGDAVLAGAVAVFEAVHQAFRSADPVLGDASCQPR